MENVRNTAAIVAEAARRRARRRLRVDGHPILSKTVADGTIHSRRMKDAQLSGARGRR